MNKLKIDKPCELKLWLMYFYEPLSIHLTNPPPQKKKNKQTHS